MLAGHALLPVLHLRADLHPGLPDVDPGVQVRVPPRGSRMRAAHAQVRLRLAGAHAVRQVSQLRRPAESLHGRHERHPAAAHSGAHSAAPAARRRRRLAAPAQAGQAQRVAKALQGIQAAVQSERGRRAGAGRMRVPVPGAAHPAESGRRTLQPVGEPERGRRAQLHVAVLESVFQRRRAVVRLAVDRAVGGRRCPVVGAHFCHVPHRQAALQVFHSPPLRLIACRRRRFRLKNNKEREK